MKGAEIKSVASDSTQAPINTAVFTPGTDRNACREIAGNHGTARIRDSHTENRGLDTLSSDTRNQPLAGTDKKLEFPNANQQSDVRITEYGDLGKKKRNPKGNVLRG